MKRWKHVFKKGMAFVLSLAMVAGLVLAMSGGANTVQAATGSGTEPSVTAYATKDQLMTAFNPDSNGDATTIGKLVFGKNSSSVAQEWHILGKDEGVSGDNTIIFAASPIATKQAFEDDDSNKKTFASSFGVYETNPSDVYPNHYGASDLRVALKNMATNTSYFTTAEQGLMNPTTVRTNDILNSTTYTTTDKLYALTADGTGSPYTTIKAGSDNNTVLAESSYWRSGSASGYARLATIVVITLRCSLIRASMSTAALSEPSSQFSPLPIWICHLFSSHLLRQQHHLIQNRKR